MIKRRMSILSRQFFMLLTLLLIGLTVESHAAVDLEEIMLKEPRQLNGVSLTTHTNQTFTEKDLQGKWTFLFFGYTHCPDICPNTLSEIDNASEHILPQPPMAPAVQYVFVSVDPKRDTPEELASYIKYFSAPYIAATGTLKELTHTVKQVDIKFSYTELTKDMYLVSHSSAIVLVDPKGRYLARFNAPHYGEDIVEKFKAVYSDYHSRK